MIHINPEITNHEDAVGPIQQYPFDASLKVCQLTNLPAFAHVTTSTNNYFVYDDDSKQIILTYNFVENVENDKKCFLGGVRLVVERGQLFACIAVNRKLLNTAADAFNRAMSIVGKR